jgi:peptidoglycan/xylan/chitin deacetylase (PgdA/CDA1 family)
MRGTIGRRARRTLLAAVAAGVTTLALLSGCGGSDEPGQASATSRSTTSASRSAATSSPTTTSPPTTASAPTTSGASPPSTTTPPPTPPPPSVPAALRGEDVTVIPTTRRVVALTFDAGANSAGLPSILATLRDQRVSATFFLTGRWAAGNRAGVRAIRADGHPYFTRLSTTQIAEQLTGAQLAIQAAGADSRPLFRFPYGDRDARTIAAVNDRGYVAVRWTVDTLGWKGSGGGMSAQKVSDRALAALSPGEIVLMHIGSNPDDGTTFDADALPDMIDRMRASGYSFVTLDQLLH